MTAFPQWATIQTDDANRLLGLNSIEKEALTRAGELLGMDAQAVMTAAIKDVCMTIRGALANNLALREHLNNSGMYDIPQSMRTIAVPLIIRALFIRYQVNMSETRKDAAVAADEKLLLYAKGELLPEGTDGQAPSDPASSRPRFTRRNWFNPIRSTFR